MKKDTAGIARIYDAIIACTILLAATGVALGYSMAVSISQPPADLQGVASSCLIYLDQNGRLAPLVYGQSSAQVDAVLTALLPKDVGFKLCVFSPDWEPIFSASDNFKQGSAASAQYYMSGHDGIAEPRIIVLSLCR